MRPNTYNYSDEQDRARAVRFIKENLTTVTTDTLNRIKSIITHEQDML